MLNSKWTAKLPTKKEKHFSVIKVKLNELDPQVIDFIVMKAELTKNEYKMKPMDLSDKTKWIIGWV